MWPSATTSAPTADAGALEELVARRARRVFDRTALAARARRDVLAIGDERPAERRGDVRRRTRSSRSAVGAQLMVEVRDADQAAARRPSSSSSQEVGERDRVGPARQRRDHARVRGAPDRAGGSNCRTRSSEVMRGWTGVAGRAWQVEAGPGGDRRCRLTCLPALPAWPAKWCRRTDSNRRPRAYETRALTN